MDIMSLDVGVIKPEPETTCEGSPISHCDAIFQYRIVKQETETTSAVKCEPGTLAREEYVQEFCTFSEIDIEYPDTKRECFVHLERIDQSREFNSSKSSIIGTGDPAAKQLVKGNKSFPCPSCYYRCSNKAKLVVHIRTHTGEKPFSCPECTHTCSQKSSLVSHFKTHTGEKPFSCPECTYKCSQKGTLVSHIKTHTGEKEFSCPECIYTCCQKIVMVRHIRTHTGEKPFSCSECSFRCSRKCVMILHIRTHTGEKPFMCPICTFRCNQKGSLVSHIKTHTRENDSRVRYTLTDAGKKS